MISSSNFCLSKYFQNISEKIRSQIDNTFKKGIIFSKMEQNRYLLMFFMVLLLAEGQQWVPYAIVDSSQAVNTYPLNLNAGDQIQVQISSQTSYYANKHNVDTLLMLNGVIKQNTTFKTPGKAVSDIYTISVGQEGAYQLFVVSQNRWPIEYDLKVSVNGENILETSEVAAESLSQNSKGYFFTPEKTCYFRISDQNYDSYPGTTYFFNELNDQKNNVYRFAHRNPQKYFYQGYLTKETIWWVIAAYKRIDYFDVQPSEYPMVFQLNTIIGCLCPSHQTWDKQIQDCVCKQDQWTMTQSSQGGEKSCVCRQGDHSFFKQLGSCCPLNSGYVEGSEQCKCDLGYIWDEDHQNCIPCKENIWTFGPESTKMDINEEKCSCKHESYQFVPELGSCCPANSGFTEGKNTCQCNENFVWHQNFQECVQCPTNEWTTGLSNIDENKCECLIGSTYFSELNSCCPANSAYIIGLTSCQCNQGYQWNAEQTQCDQIIIPEQETNENDTPQKPSSSLRQESEPESSPHFVCHPKKRR